MMEAKLVPTVIRSHPDYHRQWREENRETWNSYSRGWQNRTKDTAFAVYGTACVCCGENAQALLTIDHVEGDGASHRRTFTGPIYRWLKNNSYPSGFQTLCWNCNAAKSLSGGCPHKAFSVWTINDGG